jgi:hypothetical protein
LNDPVITKTMLGMYSCAGAYHGGGYKKVTFAGVKVGLENPGSGTRALSIKPGW